MEPQSREIPVVERVQSGHMRWMLIFWMFVISAVAYLDRVNIAIAGHSIATEFGLDNIRLGWVFSAFVFGYALFQAPGGRLADRYGPRRVLAIGTIWWAVFTSLTAFVPAGMEQALMLLIAVRFALGIGEAVVYPSSNRLVASWIPTQERGLANGLIFSGVGAGAGVAPPLITYILVQYGWRWSFWISALIGLVAGGFWYFLARDRPEEHSWVGAEELEHIRRGVAEDGGAAAAFVGDDFGQQECAGDYLQLFLLWLCRLHFLYLVFHLSEQCAGAGLEGEFLLRDAAIHRHGHLLAAGGLGERCVGSAPWEAGGTLRDCGGEYCFVGGVSGAGAGGARCADREHCAGRRRGSVVSFAERVLVGDF